MNTTQLSLATQHTHSLYHFRRRITEANKKRIFPPFPFSLVSDTPTHTLLATMKYRSISPPANRHFAVALLLLETNSRNTTAETQHPKNNIRNTNNSQITKELTISRNRLLLLHFVGNSSSSNLLNPSSNSPNRLFPNQMFRL